MKTLVKLPFYWQDEALTSRTAERQPSAAGADAGAAAIILQDFLDTDENDRVSA
jgi:RNase H-fold protein (predicted Holliday junction resolvase)